MNAILRIAIGTAFIGFIWYAGWGEGIIAFRRMKKEADIKKIDDLQKRVDELEKNKD